MPRCKGDTRKNMVQRFCWKSSMIWSSGIITNCLDLEVIFAPMMCFDGTSPRPALAELHTTSQHFKHTSLSPHQNCRKLYQTGLKCQNFSMFYLSLLSFCFLQGPQKETIILLVSSVQYPLCQGAAMLQLPKSQL